MVKVIQIILLQAIIAIVYPAHLTYFYMLCVKLAEMDFLQGALIYEKIFVLKETDAFSPTFEQYEMSNMNFMMNSGSLLIIVFLVTINFIFWTISHYLAKTFYCISCCRKLGMKAEKEG
jgi:hypothetical protein